MWVLHYRNAVINLVFVFLYNYTNLFVYLYGFKQITNRLQLRIWCKRNWSTHHGVQLIHRKCRHPHKKKFPLQLTMYNSQSSKSKPIRELKKHKVGKLLNLSARHRLMKNSNINFRYDFWCRNSAEISLALLTVSGYEDWLSVWLKYNVLSAWVPTCSQERHLTS